MTRSRTGCRRSPERSEPPALTQVECCPKIRVTAEAQAAHEDRQETEPDHDTSRAVCCCMSCWDFRHTPGQVSVPGNELPPGQP